MEKITFGDSIPGYIVGDAASPAIIVIQEWWGVTDIIKEHALMLCKAGYRCLVPDLYKGKIGVDKEEAHHVS
jgi:carboxymethylenebutenolidase